MRRSLLTLILLCSVASLLLAQSIIFPGPGNPHSAGTTPSFIQAPAGTVDNNTTPSTVAFGSNVTPNSFIVVAIYIQTGQTITSLTDTRGNTYAAAGTACSNAGSGGNSDLYIYWAKNSAAAASADTISMSWSGSGFDILMPAEFSGLTTIDGSVVCNSGASAPSPMSTGNTGTPAGSNELLIGNVREDVATTLAATNGGTRFGTVGGSNAGFYKVVSAADSAQWTTTTTGSPYAAVGVLFK
jgi:hypothetical protein